jgi:tetratricopeptide (TPR) repeat protein
LLVARLELAQVLAATSGAKSALELLDRSPEAQKNLLPVIIARNWALFGMGDPAELRKNIDGGLAAYKQSPDLILQDGLLKFQAKDMVGARKAFEQVLATRPEDIAALDALAKTFVFQKQPDLAVKTVEQHAAQRPNSAPLQNLLGYWMGTNGHRDAARNAFAAALAVDPSLIAARMSLALLDAQEGKYNSARQALAVIARVPDMQAQAEIALGTIEETVGNPSVAIPHFRKALEADPNNTIALNDLAYLLANDTEQLDEALKYAQQAKELAPNSTFVEDTLGWAFYRKGLYSSAVVHLQNAVAKDDRAVLKYHLAMAYLQAGDRLRGGKILAEARKLDPALPEAAAASKLMASLSGK